MLVMLSLIGVRGYRMTVPPAAFDEGEPIDRDDLVVPEILVEEYETDPRSVASLLRPAFDAVWTACGYPRSPNYDPDGRWREAPRRGRV